ncbi:MAG: hypothetical protein N838_18720 [Thiohalocapsa sp. PB-PSB1]|jgi:hypothetical protein|nr:MAG: hypothetical protein N838_22060 [Thiohalocapsa sp. PB-PSB1]QQO55073.1 MAG: hypothetical protein N838_18720 [Thiohalocapsa sp. PB-PSB1]
MQRYRSGIFWHFTGSPRGVDWSSIRRPSDILKTGKPAQDTDAADTAIKILESQKLLGTCVERVSETQETEKFCCVTDIPLKDLHNHAKHYGRVAIGFSATRIHKNFLPVIYIPTDQIPASKEYVKPNEDALDWAHQCYKNGNYQEAEYYEQMAWSAYGERVISALDESAAGTYFVNFIKVTDFSSKDEDTFYSEREWRHIGDFEFLPQHVEAVIAPKSQIGRLREYLSSHPEYSKQRSASLVSWEFVDSA